jgi:hypothetical protein
LSFWAKRRISYFQKVESLLFVQNDKKTSFARGSLGNKSISLSCQPINSPLLGKPARFFDNPLDYLLLAGPSGWKGVPGAAFFPELGKLLT